MAVGLVKEQEKYIVLHGEHCVGAIEIRENPFHVGNCYVKLRLESYSVDFADEMFEKLAEEVKSSLQVMISSEESEQIAFLQAGGFQCKRKCYEVEVSREDYIADTLEETDITYCEKVALQCGEKGSAEYDLCGRLLYQYYAETHKGINPLTVDYETFADILPEMVYYQESDKTIINVAFVEENEIAYVASADRIGFRDFARMVVECLFEAYDEICFEADDCDPAAMELKDLFAVEDEESFDTYTRRGNYEFDN